MNEHEDEYIPATDPGGGRPGGDRVKFERDASGNEQSIFGGSSTDIERSILQDTMINQHLLNRKIVSVQTVKDAMGAGPINKLVLRLDSGKSLVIDAPTMEINVE